MAYGQGPGQANNVGSTYEALGLSLAAAGYLTACLVCIWYTRRELKRRGQSPKAPEPVSGSLVAETFQDAN